MFNVLPDKKAHRYSTVAAVLVDEGLLIRTTFGKNNVAPFVGVTGVDGIRDEIFIGMIDGQIKDGDDTYLMIGTLEAYEKLKSYFGQERMIPVLIELDDGVRLQRALNREKSQSSPKYEEMCRRFLADSEDFAEEKIAHAKIEKRFYNDDLQKCLEQIESYIAGSVK